MTHPLQTRLIDSLIQREGGYVNHAADRGGPTRYGVTQSVARENGYNGDMRELPLSLAKRIAADRYWHPLHLGDVAVHSEALAESMFDFCYHSGVRRPAETLQRLLNVLNREQRDYRDLGVDGIVGGKTLGALQAYRELRGNDGMQVLRHGFDALRTAFLVSLAERAPSQEAFSYGWLRRVFELRGV